MRQAHLRTLAAQGLTVGNRLKITGLRTFEAVDAVGKKQLVFQNSLLGPSWPSIGFFLELNEIEHTMVSVGSLFFVTEDNQIIRSLLMISSQNARASIRNEIFLPDVGFVTSEVPKRFEPRILLAPALMLFATVAFSVVGAGEKQVEGQDGQQVPAVTCALDLSEVDFNRWLENNVVDQVQPTGSVAILTELGKLNLKTDQVLGSTQLIKGDLVCQDGRTRALQFRSDSKSTGGLVDLGVKLDP